MENGDPDDVLGVLEAELGRAGTLLAPRVNVGRGGIAPPM